MKNICSSGFKISNSDQKVLDHYLLVTPRKWAEDALLSMINKAIKTIIRDWFGTYKNSKAGNIPADISVIISEIVQLNNFKNYNIPSMENRKPQRKQPVSNEIWEGGFNIEDYEYEALVVFYKDHEQTLRDLMDNKIALRKKAFVKEHEEKLIKGPSVTEMPQKDDDLVDLITADPNYKKIKQKYQEG
jgi:hypothetical protein